MPVGVSYARPWVCQRTSPPCVPVEQSAKPCDQQRESRLDCGWLRSGLLGRFRLGGQRVHPVLSPEHSAQALSSLIHWSRTWRLGRLCAPPANCARAKS